MSGRTTYLIEKLDPNNGDDCEWEQYNLGVVEEGFFRTEATFFSEAMAFKCKAALEWLESLEEFTMEFQPRAKKRPTRSKAK